MLQFATSDSTTHSVKEQVGVALSAGCGWIRLTGKLDDSVVEEVVLPCRDAEAILILDDNLALVDRLRIHGLHLTRWTRGEVIEAREKLGPHAILGVSCPDASRLAELSGLDVDYMVIPSSAAEGNQVDFYLSFMEKVKEAKLEIHPVASGDIPVSLYPAIHATGIEGFEVSGKILDAPDAVAFLNLAINSLK